MKKRATKRKPSRKRSPVSHSRDHQRSRARSGKFKSKRTPRERAAKKRRSASGGKAKRIDAFLGLILSGTRRAGTEKHRPTAGEKATRIDIVLGLILSGTRRAEILEFTRVQWHIAEAQTDTYIAAANAIVKAESEKTRAAAFAEHLAIRQQIRKRALLSGDLGAALNAAKDEAKLRDLYPAERHKFTTWRDEVIALLREGKITPDQAVTELGKDLAEEFIVAAGIRRNEGGEAAADGAGGRASAG